MKRFRIGIDSYGLLPLGQNPMEMLRWALANGAEGVQFSGLDAAQRELAGAGYLKELGQYAASEDLYLEWGGAQHIPRDMTTRAHKDLFAHNRRAVEEAVLVGARVIRSCSGGLMRWNPKSPMTETLLRETAESLVAQRRMLEDHDVALALEVHFEFTTHELLRLLEMCGAEPGGPFGICLDTLNLLVMLEDPGEGARRLLPWVIATHIKDGGVKLTAEGLIVFPTGIGEGIVDLPLITAFLGELRENVHLSIEDHGGSFTLPIFEPLFLSKFPDLSVQELARVIRLAQRTEDLAVRGSCTITGRDEWPKLCDARMKRNIEALRRIVQGG